MGRCYDFGVEIHSGCEQAMVVTAEGGACECRACATVCPGRFGACAAVVAVPGRLPPSAPSWALPPLDGRSAEARAASTATNGTTSADAEAGPSASASAVPAARRAPPPVAVAASPLTPSRSANGHLANLPERQSTRPSATLVEAVEALRQEVRDRDDQLVASLEAFAAHQRNLWAEIDRIGSAVERLPVEIDRVDTADLSEQVAQMGELVNLRFSTVSDEIVRIGVAIDRLAAMVIAIERRLAKPASLREALSRRL